MKLTEEQLAAAVDLLRTRVKRSGASVQECAAGLCAGELRGWVTAEELLAAWQPETAPVRWVEGDHDRRLDYYDPEELQTTAESGHTEPGPVGPDAEELEWQQEVIRTILRRLEAGGGLLERKVVWAIRYYSLQPGEEARPVAGGGRAVCAGGLAAEWLDGAVLIERSGAVVKVFPEARWVKLRRKGAGTSKGPVVVMRVPKLSAPKLAVQRIALNVAVLLKRLHSIEEELRSSAAIARAANMTRANVSWHDLRMAAEEERDRNSRRQGAA